MENRFLEMDQQLKQISGKGGRSPHFQPMKYASGMSNSTRGEARFRSVWSQPFAASDRTLVVLLENGGVDLGIPTLVEKLLSAVPGASALPDSVRKDLVEFIREKIKSFTDQLLESAELYINRYSAAKPDHFGDVIVLRDGTTSYSDLKTQLLSSTNAGRIVDLFVLTHGSGDFISVPGGINASKIRAMKTELGKPLSIRSVYMMNCVGSSLNQAWLDAGARVSSGAMKNNYLPEPSMYFFWRNWQEGQTFENAVTSAYRKTINLMNDAVRGFVDALPFPGTSALAKLIDFADFEFVQDSAPVIQGQRTLTISSDNLSAAQSMSNGLATTVLPVRVLRALSAPDAGMGPQQGVALASRSAIEFIKSQEPFQANLGNDLGGHCSIGYGSVVHEGNCAGGASEQPYITGISEEHANTLLSQKAGETQKLINESVLVQLNQNQKDALVSFVYDIGADAFRNSTLLKALNQGNYGTVPAEMKKWVKARQNNDFIDVPELVKRREAEAELFQRPFQAPEVAQSLSRFSQTASFRYVSPSIVMSQSRYSQMQNPAVAAPAIAIADAASIGLATVSVVQAQVAASQGSFTLTYDKAQRLLNTEARTQMPGAQTPKQVYSRSLLNLAFGRAGTATADILIKWEGNAYGEIATPVIERNLSTSTDWSKSSANITITQISRIPLPNTDPRVWPIVYTYTGTYDPLGNGHFEFSGEFEVNAFGGLKFNRHEVVSRSLADWAIAGSPEEYVQKGPDVDASVPQIPQEQLNYLKTKLP